MTLRIAVVALAVLACSVLFTAPGFCQGAKKPNPAEPEDKKARFRDRGSYIEDTLPEDMSLVLDTSRGLVVVSGCGHSGIVNTLEYAKKTVRDAPVHAALAGFHLFAVAKLRACHVVAVIAIVADDHADVADRDERFRLQLDGRKPAVQEVRAVSQHLQLLAPASAEPVPSDGRGPARRSSPRRRAAGT